MTARNSVSGGKASKHSHPGKLQIYTDGASRGNPGPGGYGTILIWNGVQKELSGGFRRTTNNRMELMAVIAGLEALKKEGLEIMVYSDSAYVVRAVKEKWLIAWIRKDFAGKKNQDLWMRLYRQLQKHKVEFVWVKGHHVNLLNNRCDELATGAADGIHLKEDEGFEKR
ncbi:MAG TPA: ribonuclease HI [Chitinophagaceae bacterium]|nr:ribonuclease HI [Chitinophagaceae bacterium]